MHGEHDVHTVGMSINVRTDLTVAEHRLVQIQALIENLSTPQLIGRVLRDYLEQAKTREASR